MFNNTIDILVGTFCGEKYLAPQLDSLLKQDFSCLDIYVRDEGSQDLSLRIISEFQTKSKKLTIVDNKEGRLGCCGNFSKLLEHSKANYIMFSDQDDIWLPEKVKITFDELKKLEKKYGENIPILVHTDLIVVDKELNPIAGSFWRYQHLDPEKGKSFNRLLVQNTITGCTVMINRALRNLAFPIPEGAIMHDWWLALIAAAFGRISYIPKPTVLYRQHEKNAIGAKKWGVLSTMMRVFAPREGARESLLLSQRQAMAFLERFEAALPLEIVEMVRCYAELNNYHYLRKLYYLFRYRFFKVGLLRNVGLLIRI